MSKLAGGEITWVGGYRYEVCPVPPKGKGTSRNPACECYGCGFMWTDGTPSDYEPTFAKGQPDNMVNLTNYNILLNL